MKIPRSLRLVTALAALGCLAAPADALHIALTFTANWNNPANWNNLNDLTNATVIVQLAAEQWEASIQDDFTIQVTVDWAFPGGGQYGGPQDLCGFTAITATQLMPNGSIRPMTATVTFDRTNYPNLFIDPTPLLHEEFNAGAYAWQGTAPVASPANGKQDLLSCARHELGHAMCMHYNGFLPYDLEVNPNNAVDILDFGGKTLRVGNLNNVNAASHFDPAFGVPGTAISMSDFLMCPNPKDGSGRVFMAPYEISAVAVVLGLPEGVGYHMTPEGPIGPAAVFFEGEPNNTKAQAQPFVLFPGSYIQGITTGTSTDGLNMNNDSADYYKITTTPTATGIYVHRLTLHSDTPGQIGSIRGLSQAAGVIAAGTDVGVQYSSTNTHPSSFCQWYGFGNQEQIYYRVTGDATTLQPYQAFYSRSEVTPRVLAPALAAGQITISTVGLTSADTDMWVYDSNFTAVAGFGNDDEPAPGVTAQSMLVRNFAAGTYYLAISTYNSANDQAAAADDRWKNGSVLDFPDAFVSGSASTSELIDVKFDDGTLAPVVHADKIGEFNVAFVKFTVVAANNVVPFCPGDGNGGTCPCGNTGSAGHGCSNSVDSNGALLAGSGNASVSVDSFTLQGSGMPNSSALYYQGTAQIASGLGQVFGDGLRCAGGSVIRLGTKVNVAGSSHYPGVSDLSISVRGLVMPGSTRTYQIWYRNSAAFCTPSTFNLSNGLSVLWSP